MMIVLDMVVATLLLATIFYAWKLSKSISSFRESKKEMAEFINQFGSAIIQAEDSITKLKTLNREIDSDLRVNIERARFLANDLSFLIHKGGDVADRMENNMDLPKLGQNIKKSSAAANEFVNRVEKISTGALSNSSVATQPKSRIPENPITKKLAVQEALANLQRVAAATQRNMVKVPQPAHSSNKQNQDKSILQSKEKRLFDLLKFGKQLEVSK